MFLIIGTLLLLCFSLAEASTGKIAGSVRDAVSGDPLPGANVSLVGLSQGAVANEQGRFFILNVAPGVYALTATYIGYRPLTLEDVRVSADLTATADLSLASDDVQVEALVVRAERPIIDKNATNAVRIVEGKDIEALPFRGVYNVLVQQAGEAAEYIRRSLAEATAVVERLSEQAAPLAMQIAADAQNAFLEPMRQGYIVLGSVLMASAVALLWLAPRRVVPEPDGVDATRSTDEISVGAAIDTETSARPETNRPD